MAFIYRADAPRPTKVDEIKGSRIAITAGDASLAIFTAFMGKLGMKVEDVNDDHRREPAGQGAGRPQQAGRRAPRLLHGPGAAHAAPDRGQDGMDAALRHGRRLDALERDHRQQQLAQGRQEPGPAAALPARLPAWLAVHLRQPRRGRGHLHQAGAGVQQGDRAPRDQRHHDDHPQREDQGEADRVVVHRRLEGQPGSPRQVREARSPSPI